MNYAIKKVRLSGPLQQDKITNEFRLLGKINHPNIVRYHNAWFEDPQLEDQELSLSSEQELTAVDSNSLNLFGKSKVFSASSHGLLHDDDQQITSISFSRTFSTEL